MACGAGAGDPADAVTNLFDAFRNGDGEKAVSYLSEDVIAEISEGLEELKADPVGAAQQLSSFGVEISAEELADMTPREFAARIMSSPMIAGMVGSAEVEVGEAVVDGDNATVTVTVRFMGDETIEDVPLTIEDGSWKVAGEFGFSF
jgi:hypothetical protein